MRKLVTWWQNLPERMKEGLLLGLITALALAPRLPGLDVFLTADEPKSWFGRSIQFLDALARGDWAATFDSPAPGVTTMWAGAIGLLLEYARQGFPGDSLTAFLAALPFDPLDPGILPLVRLPIVVIAAAAAPLTYRWGRPLLGQKAALLAALFIALDPFLLALTRILGHDGLVTVFMWLSLLAFLRSGSQSLREGAQSSARFDRRYLLLSGALGGLAFLSKYPSLFLGAFIAGTMLVLYLRAPGQARQALRPWAIDVGLWSLAAGLIFVALWPAMWTDPLGRTLAIIQDALRASSAPHQAGSFFLGRPVPDPGAGFYPLVTLFRTTPLLWLGWLSIIALAVLARLPGARSDSPPQPLGDGHPASPQGSQTTWQRVALILLAYAVLYGLLVTVGGKKQDRYILPAFPALAALAALGYIRLAGAFARKAQSNSRILAWLLPALLVIQLALVLPHYPYYFTYYNPALGGGQTVSRTMIVGWGEGLDRAAQWLNGLPAAQNTDVVSWYSTTFEPFFQGHAIYKIGEDKISRTAKPGLAADYVVFYINQVQRDLPSPGALQFFRAVPPAHTITLNGIDYAWIYPSVGMEHALINDARLVGQAGLLGYNLHNDAGRPATALPSNGATIVQLYWDWQGKSPDDPIRLSLVDETGQAWGWGNPLGTQARLPFEEWQPGMVARDDFALVVFPGTPPGEYYLRAWIDRPATGEVVGVFPLAADDARLAVERPASPPALADLPLSQEVGAFFAAGMTLAGLADGEDLAAPWKPGQDRELVLYWLAEQPIARSYAVNLALVDRGGIIRAEWSGSPAGGRFPTDRWQPGEVVRDPWRLTLPPHVPPGEYRLTVSVGGEAAITLAQVSVEGRPRQFELPALDLPQRARFGDAIELAGIQAPLEGPAIIAGPGQALQLALIWRATGLPAADYTVTVQLIDGQGQVQAQQDQMPQNGNAPTTSWATGEVIRDDVSLSIPANAGSGPHRLLVALYRPETGQRLPLTGGPFDGQDHLEIPVTLR